MAFIIPLNYVVADWLDDSSAEQILDLDTLLNKTAASLQFRANFALMFHLMNKPRDLKRHEYMYHDRIKYKFLLINKNMGPKFLSN